MNNTSRTNLQLAEEFNLRPAITTSICWRQELAIERGETSHGMVNPNIDGHGLTADDFDDPDFAEDYWSGAYDVPCDECIYNVTYTIDLDRAEKLVKTGRIAAADLHRYLNEMDQQAADAYVHAQEMRGYI